jgi:hypothetical protein
MKKRINGTDHPVRFFGTIGRQSLSILRKSAQEGETAYFVHGSDGG